MQPANTSETKPNTTPATTTKPDNDVHYTTVVENPPAEPDTTDSNPGSTIPADTKINTTFKKVDGDGTSIYAVVDQEFDGTTTYQWQKSSNTNLETWNDVNTRAAKSNQLKISIDDYLRNNTYRCRITNVDSKGATTVYYTEDVNYSAYEVWKLLNS